jgi:Rrf2 family protein
MHFSKASTYGIRSVAYLASHEDREIISIRELSETLIIPAAFLTKVMQRLAARDIVVTARGHGGGVSLGRPAGQITLLEVMDAIEGEKSLEKFQSAIPMESLGENSPFRIKWLELNRILYDFFSGTNFSEFDGFHDDSVVQSSTSRREQML